MKTISAGKAKNGFGLLIDTARAEPVTIAKHGRPVAVMLSAEEYERLKALADGAIIAAKAAAVNLEEEGK
jgi:prevent-host-death family protein